MDSFHTAPAGWAPELTRFGSPRQNQMSLRFLSNAALTHNRREPTLCP